MATELAHKDLVQRSGGHGFGHLVVHASVQAAHPVLGKGIGRHGHDRDSTRIAIRLANPAGSLTDESARANIVLTCPASSRARFWGGDGGLDLAATCLRSARETGQTRIRADTSAAVMAYGTHAGKNFRGCSPLNNRMPHTYRIQVRQTAGLTCFDA